MRTTMAMALASLSLLPAGMALAGETDWKKIDLVFGRTAAVSGAVHRYGLPRTDLKVTPRWSPAQAGLRAWAAGSRSNQWATRR